MAHARHDAHRGPGRHGGHKFDPAGRARLDSEERRAYLDPEAILEAFRIGEGMRIADVGAGIGFFARPAARRVGPKGRVYAVDLSPEMLEDLHGKVDAEALANVEAVLSTEDRIPIGDGSIDFAFLACVLHELAGAGTLLECRRILAPRGRLGVVDWRKIDQAEGPPKEHRLDEAEAAAILKEAGFAPTRAFMAGPYHYGIEARRAPR